MPRAFLILANEAVRERAIRWVRGLPAGTRLEFKEPKRTLPQNDLMWGLLTDIAQQKTHMGQRYPAETWKVIFLNALGRQTRFVPALDGHGLIPIGQSSSDLSKAEMTDLIELIRAWGAENGVAFFDSVREAA